MSRIGTTSDELFERLVDTAEEGGEPDWLEIESVCDRAEAERLWAMAQDISSIRIDRLPSVPGYEVLAELGRGGMGSVYLAREERLGGRTVALKVLPRWAVFSRSLRDRFESEAAGIARLRHRHIITVYRVIDSGDVSGFTMEWIDGGSLGRLIAQGGPALRDRAGGFSASFLDELGGEWSRGGYSRYVCRVGRSIADALNTVHQAGMLHRDVKPSNILLRARGEPVLSDFGLVRVLGSSANTQTGQFVGTAAYAPPEQLRGQLDSVDQRSDVFALGVTLYHALTGRLPWPDVPTWRLAEAIEAAEPMAAHRAVSDVPRDLSVVIGRAIQADPNARYQIAGELAEDLDRVLSDRPVRARPTTLGRRGSRFARRHRRPILGGFAGGAMALALSLALVSWFVVIPGWSDGRLRLARQELLNRDPNIGLVSRVYWNEPRVRRGEAGGRGERVSSPRLENILELYASSARFAQGRRERVTEYRVVRSVHRLATGLASATEEAAGWDGAVRVYLERAGPDLFDVASYEDPDPPEPASPEEARALGLLAFLLGDYTTALRSWSRFERHADSDPVIEATMGEMYLIIGEPALAYPRLRAGFEAFPDTRSLNMSLAECAARVGDHQRAERLIERAHRLPDADGYGRMQRIHALLLESRGELDEAVAFYDGLRSDHLSLYAGNPILLDQHASLLWRIGRQEEALQVWANGFTAFGAVELLMRRFVTHLELWWAGMDETERGRRLARAPFETRRGDEPEKWGPDKSALSLADMLLAERHFRQELLSRPTPLAEAWRGRPPKNWDSPGVCAPIAELMRVEDREFWDLLSAAPDSDRLAVGEAWASGDGLARRDAERRVHAGSLETP